MAKGQTVWHETESGDQETMVSTAKGQTVWHEIESEDQETMVVLKRAFSQRLLEPARGETYINNCLLSQRRHSDPSTTVCSYHGEFVSDWVNSITN